MGRNEDLLDEVIESLNGHELGVLETLMASDRRFVHPVAGATDGQGMRDYFASVIEAFPDLTIRVDRTVSEDSTIAAECTAMGTQKGAFRGEPPTNRFGETPAIFLLDFEGAKVEKWRVYFGVTDPVHGTE